MRGTEYRTTRPGPAAFRAPAHLSVLGRVNHLRKSGASPAINSTRPRTALRRDLAAGSSAHGTFDANPTSVPLVGVAVEATDPEANLGSHPGLGLEYRPGGTVPFGSFLRGPGAPDRHEPPPWQGARSPKSPGPRPLCRSAVHSTFNTRRCRCTHMPDPGADGVCC